MKYFSFNLFLFIILLINSSCSSNQLERTPSSFNDCSKEIISLLDDEAVVAFETWNTLLKNKSPSKVAGMYAKKAVLLPTLSDEIRSSGKRIENYFVDFLKKKDIQGAVKEVTREDILDETHFMIHGTYIFKWYEKSKVVETEAYFTYIFERLGSDKYKIHHHHSSLTKAKPKGTLDIQNAENLEVQKIGSNTIVRSATVFDDQSQAVRVSQISTFNINGEEEIIFSHFSPNP